MKHLLLALMLLPLSAFAEQIPLQNLDGGETVNLEQFTGKGKWTVVSYWSHNCHVCNIEAPAVEAFYDEHKDVDVEIVGISIDGSKATKQAQDYVDRHELTFPNLIGTPMLIAMDFQSRTGTALRGTPTYLVFNREGKAVIQQAGALPMDMLEKYIREQDAKAGKAGS